MDDAEIAKFIEVWSKSGGAEAQITSPFCTNFAMSWKCLDRSLPGRTTARMPTSSSGLDGGDGAAVRIAMTVVASGNSSGVLAEVVREVRDAESDSQSLVLNYRPGIINSDLTIGTDSGTTFELKSNVAISNQGVTPLGKGFRLSPTDLPKFGLSLTDLPPVVRPYLIGRDIVQNLQRNSSLIFTECPNWKRAMNFRRLFQRVHDRVKPEREQKKRESYRKKWWIFAEPRSRLRPAINSVPRFIATCRTARHRLFSFVDGRTLPDAKIVAIALDDAYFLGCLSSRLHISWSIVTGGWLGVGNDSNYNHSDCFGKFPFPDATDSQKSQIRPLGEQLDAHRKRQQELHPKLTMTGMYNVLEKLRSGEALTKKEQEIHEQGLVSVLREIHDELDAAVAEAYGWPVDLSEEEILARLVALNHERAEAERRGIVRWLRPEFQNPSGVKQTAIVVEEEEEAESGELIAEGRMKKGAGDGMSSAEEEGWVKGEEGGMAKGVGRAGGRGAVGASRFQALRRAWPKWRSVLRGRTQSGWKSCSILSPR